MAKISTKDIARAIYESVKDKTGHDLSVALSDVVSFLAKKNLLNQKKLILDELENIIDDDLGIVRASVSSKSNLSRSIKEDLTDLLKKRYKAKELLIEHTEDKHLLGGVRIQVRDEVLDLTLKNRVNKLQEYLLEN